MLHENIHALKCYVGGQVYGLDVDPVLAIERGGRVTPNAASDGPGGWINWGGADVPVYTLAERLGVRTWNTNAGAVIILNSTDPWGLAVERITRFERTPEHRQPLPPAMGGAKAACFAGASIEEGQPILYLEPERLRNQSAAPPVAMPAPGALKRAQAAAPSGRLLLFSPANPVPVNFGGPEGPRSLLFSVSYTQVAEIVSGIEMIPVPSAPAHVLGMIAWRERPVAVIDAGALLGLAPAKPQDKGRLLITWSPRWDTPVAIPVGRELRIQSLPFAHRPYQKELPLERDRARGLFETPAGAVLIVPDVDAIAGPMTA